MTAGSSWKLQDYGDRGLLIDVPDLPAVVALAARLSASPIAGQLDVVSGARSVLVTVTDVAQQVAAREALVEMLSRPALTEAASAPGFSGSDVVRIEVVYDGPDLAEVATLSGLSEEEVIRAHTASVWTVAFTGFAPGFGYLIGGDPRLQVPRRSDPRPEVPAGSVGLAGEFSGVYPRASPGGWQLIGRTAAVLWDENREPPALFEPGARVRFSRSQF